MHIYPVPFWLNVVPIRLFLLFNIVRVIKSKTLRSASHVARMQKGRSVFRILTGKSRGNNGLVVDGMIILDWTLKK